MTNLLALKEKIVGFYKNNEYLVNIIGKFILALLAFNYVNTELGYFETLTGILPTLFLSVLCAIVPVSVLHWLSYCIYLNYQWPYPLWYWLHF